MCGMSDAEKNTQDAQGHDAEGQDGAVRDVDDPQVEADTNSGGAPEEPDTDSSVYSGEPGD